MNEIRDAHIEAYRKCKALAAGWSFLAETRREEMRCKAVCDCIEDLIRKENEMSTSDPGSGILGWIINTPVKIWTWLTGTKKPDPPSHPPAPTGHA